MDFNGVLGLKNEFLIKSGLDDAEFKKGPYNIDYKDDFGSRSAITLIVSWKKDNIVYGCVVEPEIVERKVELGFDEALGYSLKGKDIPETEKFVDFTQKLWKLADAIRNSTAENSPTGIF